jgi:DNA polymerase-3 subunit alpha
VHTLVDEPAWPDKRRLQEEKVALGFFVSGHLFDAYRTEIRQFARTKLSDLTEGRDKLVAGVITSLRTQMTQRGKMIIVLLDDGTAQVEGTIFNETYEANKALFKEDELLVVQGMARNDAFTGGLRFTVDTVMDLERARSRYARSLRLSINGNADPRMLRALLEPHRATDPPPDPAALEAARAAAQSSRGNGFSGGNGNGNGYGGQRRGAPRDTTPVRSSLPVSVYYRSDTAESEVVLGDAWRVKPSDSLLIELQAELAGGSVQIVY